MCIDSRISFFSLAGLWALGMLYNSDLHLKNNVIDNGNIFFFFIKGLVKHTCMFVFIHVTFFL